MSLDLEMKLILEQCMISCRGKLKAWGTRCSVSMIYCRTLGRWPGHVCLNSVLKSMEHQHRLQSEPCSSVSGCRVPPG